MRIDVIWCDFGGVLTGPIDEAVAAIEEAADTPWPQLHRAMEEVARRYGLHGLGPLELGVLTQRAWGAAVASALPRPPAIDLGDFGRYWYRGRALQRPLIDELERCRQHGARIGLLTNSVAEWEPLRAELLAGVTVFDAVVRSHEVGIAKPDSRIFTAADRWLPPKSGTLLIDDLPANIAAARRHGWQAINHRSLEQTVSALSALHHGQQVE